MITLIRIIVKPAFKPEEPDMFNFEANLDFSTMSKRKLLLLATRGLRGKIYHMLRTGELTQGKFYDADAIDRHKLGSGRLK